jgi:hypothetical protein
MSRTRFSMPWTRGTSKPHNCYAAIAVRLLPELPKLQATQFALQLFIDQHGDANEFDDASIESAQDLLGDIEMNPEPPHAPGFAKNPPTVPD